MLPDVTKTHEVIGRSQNHGLRWSLSENVDDLEWVMLQTHGLGYRKKILAFLLKFSVHHFNNVFHLNSFSYS